MASSVVLSCCISPPIRAVPNIQGPPSDELFHTSWINSRKAAARAVGVRSRNYWFSRNAAAAGRRSRHSWISAISAIDDDINAHSPPPPSSTLPSRISPWLMLPPSYENGNTMVYNFYSLKDDKVTTINKRDPSEKVLDDEPADDSELKGSSHGWLALYNRRNLDLFLSNPLSRRHIKLPPIHNLPGIPKLNLNGGFGCVESVILSSPPDDEDCCAILIYAPTRRLAFCRPRLGSTTQWTPIRTHHGFSKDSCVYSSTQKLFFCVNNRLGFEVLDVRDPSSPKCFPLDVHPDSDDEDFPWHSSSQEDWLRKKYICDNTKFLVVAEPNSISDLFLVTRHTIIEMYPDGISGIKTLTLFDALNGDYHYDADGMRYPYKTFDFTVHKYDPQKREWKYMDGSLDGLAIFIGNNHSFAMRACDFPELKPDSIYFTDVPSLISSACDPDVCNFGGHDIGIYNYKDKTLSPCYYPCDVQSIKRIEPAPMWFTPSPL